MNNFQYFGRPQTQIEVADIRHYGGHERCGAVGVDPISGRPFTCSIRRDVPHTIHEAAGALEIVARWEDPTPEGNR